MAGGRVHQSEHLGPTGGLKISVRYKLKDVLTMCSADVQEKHFLTMHLHNALA